MSLNKAPWILQQIVEKRYIICVTSSVTSVEIATVLLLSVSCNTSIPECSGPTRDSSTTGYTGAAAVALSLAAALAARDITHRTTATQQQETARIARYIPKIAI